MWNWLQALLNGGQKNDKVARCSITAPNQGNSSNQVIIYTRHGCHLCDEARQLLEKYSMVPEMIDIDSDPILQEQYTNCVPVVSIDGRVRFRGRVNEVLLRRLLRSRSTARR